MDHTRSLGLDDGFPDKFRDPYYNGTMQYNSLCTEHQSTELSFKSALFQYEIDSSYALELETFPTESSLRKVGWFPVLEKLPSFNTPVPTSMLNVYSGLLEIAQSLNCSSIINRIINSTESCVFSLDKADPITVSGLQGLNSVSSETPIKINEPIPVSSMYSPTVLGQSVIGCLNKIYLWQFSNLISENGIYIFDQPPLISTSQGYTLGQPSLMDTR
ncbi:MAG: hypothetical protein LBS44_01560 [Deltaproteobacteria bacterium]|jgi:hypothetical protein|nr:hypothetical protein [Deltaproteobacteria bacterium]